MTEDWCGRVFFLSLVAAATVVVAWTSPASVNANSGTKQIGRQASGGVVAAGMSVEKFAINTGMLRTSMTK